MNTVGLVQINRIVGAKSDGSECRSDSVVGSRVESREYSTRNPHKGCGEDRNNRTGRERVWCLWCLFGAKIGPIYAAGLKELKLGQIR